MEPIRMTATVAVIGSPVALITDSGIEVVELGTSPDWIRRQVRAPLIDVVTAKRLCADGAVHFWFDHGYLDRGRPLNPLAVRVANDLAAPLPPRVRGAVLMTCADVAGSMLALSSPVLTYLDGIEFLPPSITN